ncbi:MAG: hypothetical protein PHI32_15510 [Dysgonamonadaceae bacterium]|nr:hypothetical protein [Dysgonamonadaceae bacterium]MDD4728364.1 hypothetical protein [Dysgonamonadaceae bacterium]
MTNKETVNRNIGLTFDFARQIIENPNLIDELDDNCTIDFLQKDYPETKNADDVVADKYIRIKRSFELL